MELESMLRREMMVGHSPSYIERRDGSLEKMLMGENMVGRNPQLYGSGRRDPGKHACL